MKGNMKKLAVFVIVAAITMFTAVAMAKVTPPVPPIRGQYAATSGATCMIAPFGFNPDLTPINNAAIISMQNRQGTFTFKKNGTGSVTSNGSQIILSYIGPNGPVPPSASSQTISWDFTYTVDDGLITITQVPGTYFVTNTSGPNNGVTYQIEGSSITGTITPDRKNIILNADASNLFTIKGAAFPPIGSNISCSSTLVLIWEHD